ncbi:histidine utilization repressor [Acidocella sp.]|uniref:histidine utilization repressor n=1 Tax=Acidocella sp. TaxID=50710 RepID=UPI002601ED64|nr:histidine utilization repressor [Acidocella sp.]
MNKPPKLYERVKRHLREGIAAGTWPAGGRIPSEFELMERLGASRMTVHRALRELSAEGVLHRVQGVGSFVQPREPRSALLEIHDIAEDITARGHSHQAQVLALTALSSSAAQSAEFSLPPRAPLFYSEIVHFESGTPVQFEQRFISPGFAPGYLGQDFTQITPNRYLQSIAPPDEVEHILHAVAPDERTQQLLAIGPHEPCLRLSRRTWWSGAQATRSVLTHPGSRYALGSRYQLAGWSRRPG